MSEDRGSLGTNLMFFLLGAAVGRRGGGPDHPQERAGPAG